MGINSPSRGRIYLQARQDEIQSRLGAFLFAHRDGRQAGREAVRRQVGLEVTPRTSRSLPFRIGLICRRSFRYSIRRCAPRLPSANKAHPSIAASSSPRSRAYKCRYGSARQQQIGSSRTPACAVPVSSTTCAKREVRCRRSSKEALSGALIS